MTAAELLDKAELCEHCKNLHPQRLVPAHPVRGDQMWTTTAPDGHPYSPLLDERTIARLRELIPAPARIRLSYDEATALVNGEPSPATWVADKEPAADRPVAAAAEPEPVKPAAKRARTPRAKAPAGTGNGG